MKRLTMENGDVRDATPDCPECGRPLAPAKVGWDCYNCNETYALSTDEVDD